MRIALRRYSGPPLLAQRARRTRWSAPWMNGEGALAHDVFRRDMPVGTTDTARTVLVVFCLHADRDGAEARPERRRWPGRSDAANGQCGAGFAGGSITTS